AGEIDGDVAGADAADVVGGGVVEAALVVAARIVGRDEGDDAEVEADRTAGRVGNAGQLDRVAVGVSVVLDQVRRVDRDVRVLGAGRDVVGPGGIVVDAGDADRDAADIGGEAVAHRVVERALGRAAEVRGGLEGDRVGIERDGPARCVPDEGDRQHVV